MIRMKAYQIYCRDMSPLRLFTPQNGARAGREIAQQYWEKYPEEMGQQRYISARFRGEDGLIITGNVAPLDSGEGEI
jgi:hypothetical protein